MCQLSGPGRVSTSAHWDVWNHAKGKSARPRLLQLGHGASQDFSFAGGTRAATVPCGVLQRLQPGQLQRSEGQPWRIRLWTDFERPRSPNWSAVSEAHFLIVVEELAQSGNHSWSLLGEISQRS